MTSLQPATSLDTLIASLDPTRDYGERSYEDVVEQARSGLLVLEPGQGGIPVIRDGVTYKAVRGTAKAIVHNIAPNEQARRQWRQRFLDDEPELYAAAKNAVLNKGDMKALELLLKYGVGDHREGGSDAGTKAVEMLFEMAKERGGTRRIEIDQQ